MAGAQLCHQGVVDRRAQCSAHAGGQLGVGKPIPLRSELCSTEEGEVGHSDRAALVEDQGM